jgi:hypothetical protein
MTPPEMAWMNTMVIQDDKDDYEEKLNFIEYLASFSNPEAIKKIKHQRTAGTQMSDEKMEDVVTSISGRQAPKFQGRK